MHLLELALAVWLGSNLVLGVILWAKYRRHSMPSPSLVALQSIGFVPSNPQAPYPVAHICPEVLRRIAYGEMDEEASSHPHCKQGLIRKQSGMYNPVGGR